MANTRADKGKPSDFRLNQTEKLRSVERVTLLIIVGMTVVLDLAGIGSTHDVGLPVRILGISATLTFALYIWSPLVATLSLGIIVALAFVAGDAVGPMLAGSVAAVLVLRLASTSVILGYVAGLLVSSALLSLGFGTGNVNSIGGAIYLIVATVAGALGLALRMAYARGHRLEDELAERAEQERQAVLAERRWIAGELHDSIAHYLTIVALHVQLLDDEATRAQSQDAIRIAARKALTDLRFVIQLAEDTPNGGGMAIGDLADAIDEARQELSAAGHPTVVVGDPANEDIPRGVDIILGRIVRESATNILKYAGDGEVQFSLDLHADSIALLIRSPLPTTPRRDLPSTGTGLNRMAERVLGVSGTFSAGPVDDLWEVSVCLPLESTPELTSPQKKPLRLGQRTSGA